MVKLVVDGQNLYRYSTGNILADDSVDFVELEFSFSSEWEGMEKTAQFIQDEKVYSVILVDDKCCLPAEITEGSFFITVFGYAGERRGTTRKLQETLHDSGFGQGEVPVPPTPDLYAQLLVKIDEAVKEAQSYSDEAKQAVNDARQAVSNMEASAKTVPYGTPASVTKTLNEAGAVVLKFNIPQGKAGERGAKGDKGDPGKRGERGPEGLQGPKGEPFTYQDFTEEQLEGLRGQQGERGKPGAVFVPTVSPEGVVSWSNDGGLKNPEAVNIKGPKGDKGDTGEKGEKGETGAPGRPGEDAPQINDAIITDANPWSAKKIVDTLAPTFESSGPVVTCNPVESYPLNVVSQIVPVQEGSGDPSPENVRPIRGWDAANLQITGKNIINTSEYNPASQTITLPFGQTVYGGTLDWTTGVLTVDKIVIKANSDTTIGCSGVGFYDTSLTNFYINLRDVLENPTSVLGENAVSNQFKLRTNEPKYKTANIFFIGAIGTVNAYIGFNIENTLVGIDAGDSNDVAVQKLKSYLSTNPFSFCVVVGDPQTIQLTPQEILALSGTNTIYTDTGDTTVSGRADPNAIIQQLAARIAALEGAATNL